MNRILSDAPTSYGTCDPDFAGVRRAFENNFIMGDEIGAAVSVYHAGRKVVDLWGGLRNQAEQLPWQEDTLVCFMSTTKAIASLAVLSLVDRYGLDLDKPMAHYWPAFAQAGKAGISVRCVLSQLAGLPVIDAAPAGSFYDQDVLEQGLEVQAPLWEPGTTPCYHSFTHGPLCQKLVSLVTGKSLGRYLREDLLGPLGIEFLIGLTDEEITRCADLVFSDGIPTLMQMRQPDSLLHRAWRPVQPINEVMNQAEFRRNEFGSGSGHSTARDVAKLFGLLASALCQPAGTNAVELLSRPVLEDAITEQWDDVEKITHRHFRYGTGFMLNNAYFTTGPNQRTFGHPGLGGAIGFADPVANIGFAYAGNRIHAIDSTGPCAGALIEAVYNSLTHKA
ncbi:MAG: beta-lactamase family protein [Hahellaceae bacterium]|nr:beta-lactamase family protein [Hahellaceae bacterium]MCP5170424.1 beta-lactamase family protein [Hahellaceae bacterium]